MSQGFTHQDRVRLRKALKQAGNCRTYQRLSAVSFVAQGKSISEVARMLGISRQSVHNWIGAYLRTHQPSNLYEAPRTGRPIAAAAITPERILQALDKSPRSEGYMINGWTVATLAHYLSTRYKCPIQPATLRRRMKATGLRCKRPRYVYAEKDPNRAQKKGRLSES